MLSDSDKICRGLRCARIATAPEMQNGEISIEVNDRGYYSYHNLASVKHRENDMDIIRRICLDEGCDEREPRFQGKEFDLRSSC
jgi:hypothetical protein